MSGNSKRKSYLLLAAAVCLCTLAAAMLFLFFPENRPGPEEMDRAAMMRARALYNKACRCYEKSLRLETHEERVPLYTEAYEACEEALVLLEKLRLKDEERNPAVPGEAVSRYEVLIQEVQSLMIELVGHHRDF